MCKSLAICDVTVFIVVSYITGANLSAKRINLRRVKAAVANIAIDSKPFCKKNQLEAGGTFRNSGYPSFANLSAKRINLRRGDIEYIEVKE